MVRLPSLRLAGGDHRQAVLRWPRRRLGVLFALLIESYSAKGLTPDEAKKKDGEFKKNVADSLRAAGYPAKADPAKINKPLIVAILNHHRARHLAIGELFVKETKDVDIYAAGR